MLFRSTIAWLAGALFLSAVPAHAVPAQSGAFVVLEPTVTSRPLRELARSFHRNGTLEELVVHLNAMFVLPRTVGVRLMQCGESNAYYDPEEHEIQMCLELVEGMGEILRPQFEDDEDFTDALAGAFIATALHEVGHALVHVLELPITGREEDAVDQLAAWMLIESGDSGSVLGAAAAYYSEYDPAEEDFSSEHSLDRQRYFNHVCWVYGSDPGDNEELISDWELPMERAERCEDEYQLLDRSWKRLLRDHLRPGRAEPAARTATTKTPRTENAPRTQNAPTVEATVNRAPATLR